MKVQAIVLFQILEEGGLWHSGVYSMDHILLWVPEALELKVGKMQTLNAGLD